MIDIKELRVGNNILFSDDSTIFEVVEIDKNGLHVKNDNEETWIELENFEGIKLTEELLLRLGYEELRQNNFYIRGHQIWRIENRFYCDKNGVELQYLHDLQNLYYSLCKTELTLKP